MEATPTTAGRRNRVILAVALVVAVAVIAAGAATYLRGRAVTVDAVERAFEKQPQDYPEFERRLGLFVQAGYYATVAMDTPELVRASCEHPSCLPRILWYPGRGGRAAVAQVQYIQALHDPWQHSAALSDAGADVPSRSYCMYLAADGTLLGWADLTEAPNAVELMQWALASRPGKHPGPEGPK